MVNKRICIFLFIVFLIFVLWFWMGKGYEVILEFDGKVQRVLTTASDVEEFLKINNISLDNNDLVTPNVSTKITEGLSIKITEVNEKELVLKEEIPYEKVYRNDNSLTNGQLKVIQKGKSGIKTKKYLITYHDNIEHKRELIEEKILSPSIPEIIARGTKQTVQRAGKSLDVKKTFLMKASAYTHTGSKTSTGVWPKKGIVAVDPKVIPLGSKLYIDGYGFATAQDVGTAIKGNRIDLFMETKNEAMRWGYRTVKVFILN